MSATITVSDDVIDEPRPKVAAEAGPKIEVVDDTTEPGTGPSPEEAVAAANQRAEQFQRERDLERQRAQNAEQDVARARVSQQQDQVAVLASAVEAANAEAVAARGRLRAAKEQGDFEAEALAYDELASARARHDRAGADLEVAKTRAPQQHQPSQPNSNGITPATQAWINAHPQFQEPATRDALLAVHGQLLADGVIPESRAYFRALDTEYARLTANTGDQDTMDTRGTGRGSPASSSAAPPSRGGSNGAGGNEVRTLMGPVRVTERNGQVNIQIPPHLRADFDEGAKLCGMTTGEYAFEQVKIARERMNGGTGGLITEEGRTYR